MARIAIVHDYFTQQGGAERVAGELYGMFPKADLYSTVALPEMLPPGLTGAMVRTSWIQSLPGMRKYYRLYFAVYPLGVQAIDLSDYDLVITSSSGYAKGVQTRSNAIHVCYCHTPMRWAWRFDDYAERARIGLGSRIALPALLKALRAWDRNASRQPDQFVANSAVVARRIELIYNRHAVVIPPPIDVRRFQISSNQQDYFLVVSRLVPYKRIDLAIVACNLASKPLKIIGVGPDRKRLQQLAGPTVEFLGRLPDSDTQRYASECRALLFPGEEDFGMVPLELAAAGRPTIAFRGGGATETVIDGTTGLFFDEADARSLAAAMEEFELRSWSPSILRSHAEKFDIPVFRQRFLNLLDSLGANLELGDFVMSDKALGQAIAS
jgi:glycosyltransferase involved in cell wall biosynthesis